MAVTDAVHRQNGPTTRHPPSRSPLSRLSLGHVVMILAGLVAVLLNLAFLRSGTDTSGVLVAAQSLQTGDVLTAAAVDVVEVGNAGPLIEGLITADAARETYGATVARPLAPGEPIRRSDLRPAGTVSGLREYSIRLDAARAAGGRLAPADIVDVIATIDGRSFYVASSVEVISINTGDSVIDVGDDLIVVLGVDDRTALDLASAESVGSVAVVRATGASPATAGPVEIPPAP